MGVRRSSRDKHAPLEYWRNERKVYNREFRSESQGFPVAAHSYIVLRCMLRVLHNVFSIVP